jgi:hypothetical protein
MHRRVATVLLLGMLTTLFVGILALPAFAEITKGSCTGQATFPSKPTDKQLTAERPKDDVFDVPDTDSVQYSGNLGPGAEPSEEPVAFEGGLTLALPRYNLTVAGWEGDTEDVMYGGVYTYEIPDFVPRGTGGLELTGWHNQTGYPDCEGVVTISLQGDRGVAPLIAGGVTLLAGAGTLAAGRRKA